MEKLDDFDTGTKQEEKNVIQQGLDIVLSANTVSDYSNKSSYHDLPPAWRNFCLHVDLYVYIYYMFEIVPSGCSEH